jgi:hypothetical protein
MIGEKWHGAKPPDPDAGCSVRRSPARSRYRVIPLLSILVLAATPLVYWAAPPGRAFAVDKPAPEVAKSPAPQRSGPFTGKLPDNVAEMRDAILTAAHAGTIEELKIAIEWNELPPDFGDGAGADPIAYWKRTSGDGEGRETLAALANLLSLAPAKLPTGKDPENNAVYVWPYLAELPLDTLSPAEEVDLYRLMPQSAAKAMREKKKWTWWRLSIGADGTWHSFRRSD